jgi:hypothetical protein
MGPSPLGLFDLTSTSPLNASKAIYGFFSQFKKVWMNSCLSVFWGKKMDSLLDLKPFQ